MDAASPVQLCTAGQPQAAPGTVTVPVATGRSAAFALAGGRTGPDRVRRGRGGHPEAPGDGHVP